MDLELTNNQSYEAMLRFLKKMHDEFGWKQLGPLLGSMSLVDGVPMDIAMAKDWSEVVELSFRFEDKDSHISGPVKDRTYLAMLNFLEQMFEAGREDISALIFDMEILDEKPRDRALVESWKSSIGFAEGEGKSKPYELVKDDNIYQVHRNQLEPKKG